MSTAQQAIRARRKAAKDTRYRPQFKTRAGDTMLGRAGGKTGKGGKK